MLPRLGSRTIEIFLRVLLLIVGGAIAIYGSKSALVSIDLRREIRSTEPSPLRFVLIDFLCLFVMLQIPLLLVGAAVRASVFPLPTLLLLGSMYALLYVGIWWWGVAALSAIAVESSLRRATFLGLLQPFGMLLALVSIYSYFAGLSYILKGSVVEALIACAVLIALGGASWLYSLACDWVRAGSGT